MASLWMFCAVFSLFYSTKLQIVLAKKREFTRNTVDQWREDGSFEGNVDAWLYSSGKDILSTEFRAGGGSIWLITPKLSLPNTSYLVMGVSSDRSFCQLEIYGTTDKSPFSTNFEAIQNVTFKERSNKTITIKKSYPYLRILGRTTLVTKFSIHSIMIYHYFCEKQTIDNVVLSEVNSSTTNISEVVSCQHNAVVSDGKSKNITANCTPKGSWTLGDLTCVCDKGFQFQSNNQRCSRCSVNYYKSTPGDESCHQCLNGKTNNTMHTNCECKENHYIKDNEDGPCYGVPSEVEDLNKQILNKRSVNIAWKRPKNDGGFEGPLTYTVECYRCISQSTCNSTANNATFCPGKTNLTTTYVIVSNLTLNETYKFKVFSMNSLKNVPSDKWKFLELIFTHKVTPKATTTSTKEIPTPSVTPQEREDKPNIFIYVGAGVGFVVIVLLIILIIIFRGKSKNSGKDNHGFESLPLSQRIYVDPSAYDDPEAALKDFANEISEKNLKLERVIGGGEFGDVYKGTLKTEDRGDIEVAAKTLKHDSDQRSRRDFFLEGSAMGQFDDPNVIHLEGVITKSVPHMIVIEYMSNGSLDHFLKQNDGNLTDLQLVGMARGVASGMKYLAAMNFVHRDLAARNILVNEALLCKVADFGLSRELENEESSRGEYCATGGKIPVRWTAPEAIKYRKFSNASDVWSYGILLWEIMSFAERPYWDWDNFKVLERVDEGYRLPAPKNCPKALHELMLLCWEGHRDKRPEFSAIVGMLDDWIRSPETIRYEKLSKRPVSSASLNDPAMLIKEWLHDIKMSSYIPHFTQAGFTQLSELGGLMDTDLQSIGISLIGHRNKMLRTIRSLPITDATNKTPWNRAPSMKV